MKVLWEKQFELRAIIENYLRQKGYSKKSLAPPCRQRIC